MDAITDAKPTPTAIDLRAEFANSGLADVFDQLDRELVGLGPVKQRLREIGALLTRNNEQAEALELPGTPVYLVGPYKVAAALDYDGFKQVVKDARARAAAQ